MSEDIKRRHHYIWRFYLKAWATQEKIWCKRGNEIFQSNIMGVGQSRDFYKIKELSSDDISYLDLMIRFIDPELLTVNKRWIHFFSTVSSVRFIKPIKHTDKFESKVKALLHNTEEDLYAEAEEKAVPLIKNILNGEHSFLQTFQGRFDFIHYVCNQYFRTNRIQQRMIKHLRPSDSFGKVEIQNCWPVLRHVFSDSMTVSVGADNSFQIHILVNKGSTPLLTSDQPVINLEAINQPDLSPVEDIEFYYPIAPHTAVLISNKPNWIGKNYLSANDVDMLNNAIVKMSYEQIYSNDRSMLQAI